MKKILMKNNFDEKEFWWKIFLMKNIFDEKYFWWKIFLMKNIFDEKDWNLLLITYLSSDQWLVYLH